MNTNMPKETTGCTLYSNLQKISTGCSISEKVEKVSKNTTCRSISEYENIVQMPADFGISKGEECIPPIVGISKDSDIVKLKKTAYNKENFIQERNPDMSFVGIIFYNKKIVGFADSKSTIAVNEINMEDPERKTVQKLFQNNDFIISFSGQNSFEVDEGSGYKRIWLEDWVAGNIEKYKTPADLCNVLYGYLQKNTLKPIHDKIFAEAGRYAGDKMFAARCRLDSENFNFNEYSVSLDVNFCGDANFCDYFSDKRKLYTANTGLIEQTLEEALKIEEKKDGYCAVGRPWIVKEFNQKNM